MKSFRSFILRGNVVDLVVGIVIGAAFTAVVNGFVSAFLTPIVGLATGATSDMSRKTFTVGATKFSYGAFVNATISFLLLASALYFLVVLPINKLHERLAPHQDVQAPKRDCPECLSPAPSPAPGDPPRGQVSAGLRTHQRRPDTLLGDMGYDHDKHPRHQAGDPAHCRCGEGDACPLSP
ncbi:large conductance mechanosensitive channel protein MscL [Streptomyces sp. 1222.5]|uniref:large conductance mechanosensitive channel protein MscL n=1 Tax=Streptomyces sp. 1222.5 TaxID=1881026 RepID=UPI003D7067F9